MKKKKGSFFVHAYLLHWEIYILQDKLAFSPLHSGLFKAYYADSYLLFFGFYQIGRSTEAEAEYEKLLGGIHVKSAIAELSNDRGDESDTIKLSKSVYRSHFKGVY